MSIHINKPREIRLAQGWTYTQCGQILLGIKSARSAYVTWEKMERTNETEEHLSNGMRQYINCLMMLKTCAENKTPGAHLALEKWININTNIDDDNDTYDAREFKKSWVNFTPGFAQLWIVFNNG